MPPWPPPRGRHYGEERGGDATQAPPWPPERRLTRTFGHHHVVASQALAPAPASYGLCPNARAIIGALPLAQIWPAALPPNGKEKRERERVCSVNVMSSIFQGVMGGVVWALM
jgi:hypothetical protein